MTELVEKERYLYHLHIILVSGNVEAKEERHVMCVYDVGPT